MYSLLATLKKQFPLFLFLFVASVFLGTMVFAQVTENVDVSAVVQGNTPPANTGGGSGSGSNTNATVTLSGFTFPNARLTLLRDGVVATTLIANPDGTFQITINNLNFGNYQISIYAADSTGITSAPHTINVSAHSSQPYVYSNIIIPPTIKASQTFVGTGKPFNVTGYAPPGATVTLDNPGNAEMGSALADSTGFYRIEALASLPPGMYFMRTIARLGNVSSLFSRPIQMLVFSGDNPPVTPPPQFGTCVDYNKDGRVNLIDFSILLFWFGNSNAPAAIDCNSDRVIDLKDFSILMYFWTG
jgi:hypothetical protein